MRDNGIRAKSARKFRCTTDSNHSLPVAANVLDRQFDPERPNEAWVADITCASVAIGPWATAHELDAELRLPYIIFVFGDWAYAGPEAIIYLLRWERTMATLTVKYKNPSIDATEATKIFKTIKTIFDHKDSDTAQKTEILTKLANMVKQKSPAVSATLLNKGSVEGLAKNKADNFSGEYELKVQINDKLISTTKAWINKPTTAATPLKGAAKTVETGPVFSEDEATKIRAAMKTAISAGPNLDNDAQVKMGDAICSAVGGKYPTHSRAGGHKGSFNKDKTVQQQLSNIADNLSDNKKAAFRTFLKKEFPSYSI